MKEATRYWLHVFVGFIASLGCAFIGVIAWGFGVGIMAKVVALLAFLGLIAVMGSMYYFAKQTYFPGRPAPTIKVIRSTTWDSDGQDTTSKS